MEIIIIIGTWLPVFPGFYGTFFDGEIMYEQETDAISEHVEPPELAACMLENFHSSKAADVLWREYQQSVAEQCVKLIEKELSPEFVTSIKLEEISSPKEYNFINDSINIEVTFSAENIQAIRHFISEHYLQWKDYLNEKYSSRDGFMSFHANHPDAEEWFVDNALNDRHNAGSVLEFICGEKDINTEFLYNMVENNVSLDFKALEKECLDRGWYIPDTLWNRLKTWKQDSWPRFVVRGGWAANQYMLFTKKQTYIFAYSDKEVQNDKLIVKRYFKKFIFARLKDEKGHKD